MLFITIVISLALAGIMFFQVRWASQFVNLYSQTDAVVESDQLPFAGVVLALRGADPYLEDCLRGLMTLDYPNYEVCIIVDSKVDPAYEVVQRVLGQYPKTGVKVLLLNISQSTSSLKNAALIQGIKSFSDRSEVFAWLDSDTIPHPTWLRDLVSPLQDSQVAAACGIRWFAPPNHSVANYVRHIWNAGALLQMVAFKIGWGGAFAIRRSYYEKLGLAKKWERSLCEDTVTSSAIVSEGYQMKFVAAATMPNPENATLKWCFNFLTRQLQLVRLYHRSWKWVLSFGVISGLSLFLAFLVTAVAVWSGNVACSLIGGMSVVAFGVISGWLMIRAEKNVNRCLGDGNPKTISRPLMLTISAPVTQLVYAAALARACVLNKVTWRGIHYIVRSGMDITRLNYSPYVSGSPTLQQHSL